MKLLAPLLVGSTNHIAECVGPGFDPIHFEENVLFFYWCNNFSTHAFFAAVGPQEMKRKEKGALEVGRGKSNLLRP